ncbi:MAG: hypothetical protein AMXMBFR12_09350 [Candidatus Babeliales bacterium]
MITIAGKFFLSFILFTSFFAFPATINLKLTTLEGAALEQAGVGQPFLLNVVVTNTTNSAQYPTLKGIDNLHVRQSGFQMNMVNGDTSITYHYRVRIDTPGTYTLGPATIVEGSNTLESNSISVTVSDQQKSTGSRTQKAAAQAPTLKLICDKTNVYVGQKINCELSFYTSDPTTVLQSIIEPEQTAASGLVFKNKQNQPTTGTQKINGVEYRFARWNFQIVPTKAGTLVLPAYAAQYTSNAHQPMLSFFFHHDAKKVYSNTVPLEVQSLPPCVRAPSFIGTINQFYAQINPNHARVGEGMVLAIHITGQGDFESVGMLPIALPEQLKWYESKHYYTPASAEFGTYTMEYIVQALQPGTITIPTQDFFYFDTDTKRYKTISTAPIIITITGTPISEPASTSFQSSIDTSATIDPLAPLNLNDPIQAKQSHIVPWPVFWALIALSSIIWLLCVAFSIKKDLFARTFNLFRKKTSPYIRARARIKAAYTQKQYSAYYAVINQVFSERLGIPSAQLNQQIIENSLAQDGLSAQAIADWRLFYTEISEFSFYKANLDAQYYQQLTQKILYWVDILEKLPRVHV